MLDRTIYLDVDFAKADKKRIAREKKNGARTTFLKIILIIGQNILKKLIADM